MKITRLTSFMLTATIILSVPLVAMIFTEEVAWSPADFVVAGILLFGTGLVIEFVLRKVKNTQKRMLFCGIVLAILFLIWAELAVGVFGTPFAGS